MIEYVRAFKSHFNQHGYNLSKEDMFDIGNLVNVKLPNWYIYLMTTSGVIGLQFSYHDNPDEKKYRDMQVLDKNEVKEEMQEMSIETRPIPEGYVCFASDLLGGGDYYFLKLAQNIEDANVIQLYHDGHGEFDTIASSFIDLLKNPYVE